MQEMPVCPSCGRTNLTRKENGSFFCEDEKKIFGASEVAGQAPQWSAGTVAAPRRVALLATTPTVPGTTVLTSHGLVSGMSARARHMFSDFGAGLKSLVGGEVGGYLTLMND